MQNNYYELAVCVNSRPIREYGHKGLTYVEGRHGQHYSIKFRNNTAMRVMAVISVDGLDVVDGKPATQDSRGYIVPGYQSIEIHGWRTSKKKVNDFVFDTKPRAYSTQSQKDDINCGIVGVKVFSEQVDLDMFLANPPVWREEHHHHHHYEETPLPPYWWKHTFICHGDLNSSAIGSSGPTYGCNLNSTLRSADNAASNTVHATSLSNAGGSLMAANLSNSVNVNFVATAPAPAPVKENPAFNLGTGWGKERTDEVEEVKFKRGSEISELCVYYTDAQGLKDAGIEVDKKPAVAKATMPKAFHGFCTPPVVTSS